MSVENVFCMKTVKVDYSKNIWKEENCRQFCLSRGWLHISEKKKKENCNSVGGGAHKSRKSS